MKRKIVTVDLELSRRQKALRTARSFGAAVVAAFGPSRWSATHIRGAAALLLPCIAGLALLAPGAGCDECDAETRCLEKEGLLVEDEIYPVCGAEPTSDGDRYSWATDAGTCSCTLESGTLTGYNWRDCEFNGTNVDGETSSGTVEPGGDECSAENDCFLCVFAACRWCDATSSCASYDDDSCPEAPIEGSASCPTDEPDPDDDCVMETGGCSLCVFAACRWCSSDGRCLSYTDESCSVAPIESTADCSD